MFSVLYHLEAGMKKIGIEFSRTDSCKHRGSCICSALVSSSKAGLLSYLIKSGISILLSLRKVFKNPKKLFAPIISKESIKFGFFVFAFLIIFRAIVCGLRRVLPKEK